MTGQPPQQQPAAASGKSSGQGSLSAAVRAQYNAVVWPGIGQALAHKDLPKHLFRIASLHARRSVAAASDDLGLLDRATSIGTSIELLSKSALALINPALLADRDFKHILLFSGIGLIPVRQGKTRVVTECMTMVKQCHSIDYNQERDSAVFDVRNLAIHMGFVDTSTLEDAVNTMTALSEQLLGVIADYDSSLDRQSYWGSELLVQVDERLNQRREARIIRLEQLKQAARAELARLRARGIDDDMLQELADRLPDDYWEGAVHEGESHFQRRECPVCGFEGWLECSVSRDLITGPNEDDGNPVYWVKIYADPSEFLCHVCSLRLGYDLIPLTYMDSSAFEIGSDDATEEDIARGARD